MGKKGRPILDRLRERITVDPNGCWVWNRPGPDGYGRFTITRNTNVLVHRWMYEHHRGPIPEGLQIDHLCRNRACCNPEHLEPVTPVVNVHRGATNAAKTHCKHDHEFTEANTRILPTARGAFRICLQCQDRRNMAYRQSMARAA